MLGPVSWIPACAGMTPANKVVDADGFHPEQDRF
jgi:hypothetical protein